MTSAKGQPSDERLNSRPRENRPTRELILLNERRRIALAEIDKATLSRFHIKICLVTGVGFFTDAYDIFTITIATAMLGFVYGKDTDPKSSLPTLTKWQSAGLKLATPIGNLIGQLLFGWLADIFGLAGLDGVELGIMIIATFGQAVSGGGPSLNIVYIFIVWRVILGIGIGGDYPLSAVITSEFASTKCRGRMMTAVFAFQGWGQLAAALVGLVVVAAFKDDIQHSREKVDYAWRLLIGIGCIPATIALYFRLTIPETPRFTMDVDRNVSRAAHDIANTLTNGRYIVYTGDDLVSESRVIVPRASASDFVAHFSKWKNWKVLFGTTYSWFALDVAFYTLTLNSAPLLDAIYMNSVRGDVYKSLLHLCVGNIILVVAGYLPGFGAAFALIDIWGRKPMQLTGFIILTALFWIMGLNYTWASGPRGHTILYCFANFFQNFGPNTTTFVVPGEAFPTRYRTTAYGISAASGKLGAVIAQILFASFGGKLHVIWEVLSFVMLTGVFSTLLIPETNQRTLEYLSSEDQETYITAPGSVERTTGSAPNSQVWVIEGSHT